MPSQSIAQRRLFAIAEHHPEILSGKNARLADLPQKTLHDFAATKEKGLPGHVEHAADGWMGRARRLHVHGPEMPHVPRLADGKWMQDAFSGNKGGLHRATHTPEGETIPAYRVRSAANSKDPHVRRMANAAINANPGRY